MLVAQEEKKSQVEVQKEDDDDLKNRLVELRKTRSKEKNIPPYYVFNNEELEKILEYRPRTVEELKEMDILQQIKVISHGKEIVEVINMYLSIKD